MVDLLRRFLGPYRVKALAGVLTKVVEVIFEVLTPLVVARMIDVGVSGGDVNEVIRMGATLLAFASVSYAFTFVCQRLAAQVSQGLGTDVRNALYAHVNDLSARDLDHFGTPSLVTRVTNDVNQVQLAVALTIRTVTRWPLLALGSMIAAILIDPQLGIVFLVCMPLIGLVFGLVMRASVPYFRSMQAKLDRISLVTRESLEGMRVIRAFRQEDREQERGRESIFDQAQTSVAVGRLSAILNPATFLIMYAGVGAILWVGGVRVNVGDLSTGEVMAFVSYMTQALVVLTPLSMLVASGIARLSAKSFGDAQRLQGELSGYVEEMVSNQSLVSVFGRGKACQEEFGRINADLYVAGEHSQFVSSLSNPTTGARCLRSHDGGQDLVGGGTPLVDHS